MWIYEGKDFEVIPEDIIGFVYIITNTISDKKYIGKKLFNFVRTKKVKNKRNRVRTVKESDWKTYWGSNKALVADVELLGENNFIREILELCYTKGECSYHEAKFQFQYEVLLHPEKFYNEWIACKIHRKHVLTRRNL